MFYQKRMMSWLAVVVQKKKKHVYIITIIRFVMQTEGKKNAVFIDLLNIMLTICHIIQYTNSRNANSGASWTARSISSVSYHSP